MATQSQSMPPQEQQEERRLTPEDLKRLRDVEHEFEKDIAEVAASTKANSKQFPSLLDAINQTERDGFVRDVLSNEIAKSLYDQDARLARVFALSGAFKDLKGYTVGQATALAMTKIRMGRSWGMNEADSMEFVICINGRPSVMSEYVAARLMDAGWNWDLRWHEDDKGKCTGCTLYPKRLKAGGKSENPDDWYYIMEVDPKDETRLRKVRISFTKADAELAMIWEGGKQIRLAEKWNFISWPADMYFSKVIIRFKRRYASNILRGAMTAEEAQEIPPEGAGPARGTLKLDQLRVSTDVNRGHEDTAAEDTGKKKSGLTSVREMIEVKQEVPQPKAEPSAPAAAEASAPAEPVSPAQTGPPSSGAEMPSTKQSTAPDGENPDQALEVEEADIYFQNQTGKEIAVEITRLGKLITRQFGAVGQKEYELTIERPRKLPNGTIRTGIPTTANDGDIVVARLKKLSVDLTAMKAKNPGLFSEEKK
jgi:hypothetical protein